MLVKRRDGHAARMREDGLGVYEVVAPLGAGDPDRLMRFEREARTLASLNHPHIAQVSGIEDSGFTRALVMELVEGEDLSARIARSPSPVAERTCRAQRAAWRHSNRCRDHADATRSRRRCVSSESAGMLSRAVISPSAATS